MVGFRAVAAAVRLGHGVGGGSEPESAGYHAAGGISVANLTGRSSTFCPKKRFASEFQ
jgi:hypothetical protein